MIVASKSFFPGRANSIVIRQYDNNINNLSIATVRKWPDGRMRIRAGGTTRVNTPRNWIIL